MKKRVLSLVMAMVLCLSTAALAEEARSAVHNSAGREDVYTTGEDTAPERGSLC